MGKTIIYLLLCCFTCIFSALWMPTNLSAQEISDITFDQIPPGVSVVGDSISLQSDVDVTGGLVANDIIQSTSGGFMFPDGTVQSTAAAGTGTPAVAPHTGSYNNRIPDFIPPAAYTEICFKQNNVFSDIHVIPESTTTGAFCDPGDIGWVIERDERTSAKWTSARIDCLRTQMRLPEPLEFQYSCLNESQFGLNQLSNDLEWASNSATQHFYSDIGVSVARAIVLGGANCFKAAAGFIAHSGGEGQIFSYRCAR